MVTLDALRCLCAVVEAGSFRGAAGRVHRSQPAVSQQIKALERALGHRLVERGTGLPTDIGRLVHERARALVLAADGLAQEVADHEAASSRELRVGTSDTLALYLLPPCVGRFQREMPAVRLLLYSRHSDDVVAEVLDGRLDLGLVTLPEAHPGLEAEPLTTQRLALAVPAGHPLAGRRRATLAQVGDAPFLLLESRTRTGALLREHFRRAGFQPNVALDSGSFEVIKRYVSEGVGLAVLPEMVIAGREAGVVPVRVPGLPEISIGAVWRKGAYRTRAARHFADLARTVALRAARGPGHDPSRRGGATGRRDSD